MRLARPDSWRFRETVPQFLHQALFARDAAGLPVTESVEIPPPLAGRPAARDELVSADQRSLAGMQWATWWCRLLDYLVSDASQRWADEGSDVMERLTSVTRRHHDVFDPPDFRTLAGVPALRTVVVATFGQGLRWFSRRPDPSGLRGDEPAFSWAAVRSAVESTAAERGVPLGDLRAVVHIIDVEGLWSYLVAPGCAICSSGIAASPDAAGRLLREAFGSSVR